MNKTDEAWIKSIAAFIGGCLNLIIRFVITYLAVLSAWATLHYLFHVV